MRPKGILRRFLHEIMTPFKVVLTDVTQELYTLRQETVLVFGIESRHENT